MFSLGHLPFATTMMTTTASNTLARSVASAAPVMPILGNIHTPKMSSALRPMLRNTDSEPMSDDSFALSQTFIMP